MNGIVFLKTLELFRIEKFYCERLDFELWLDQNDVKILRHGNLLVGFCERDRVETEGMITLYYPEREDVDKMYAALEDIAETEPVDNETYGIYQFFARDPEGRMLEFQHFQYDVPGF